eukprot:GEMP01028074.1.p1 GENE.GEMP01028074.1~~GEMP01028074.1.p1  ORF type:complete len:116 (-),score=0.34 GEMP01028074.1:1892-2239(-)
MGNARAPFVLKCGQNLSIFGLEKTRAPRYTKRDHCHRYSTNPIETGLRLEKVHVELIFERRQHFKMEVKIFTCSASNTVFTSQKKNMFFKIQVEGSEGPPRIALITMVITRPHKI